MKSGKVKSADVRAPTFRTLLRMLRQGSGVTTHNDIRKEDALREIACLAGGYISPGDMRARNSGRRALSILLTNYLGKPVSVEQAAACFHNPKNRGLQKTAEFLALLDGRAWPPVRCGLTDLAPIGDISEVDIDAVEWD